MKTPRFYISLFVILLFFLFFISACSPKEKTPLVVFAAGSLIGPFDAIEKGFEQKYPDIDILPEYHGSIQVIRHTTDLHMKTDVIATADYALIPQLMYEVIDPDSGDPYADWAIRFATNTLGLAYTENSKYGDEITPENWLDILSRPDVRVGIADPRFDPSGYRALMAVKLAETLYGKPLLFSDLFASQFRFPITVEEDGDHALIKVPEVLEMKKGAHIVIRGASIQLLSLLESGDLDYAFEYDSVIKQHELKQLALPDELNLGIEELDSFYGKVQVKMDFQRFAAVDPEFTGSQIGYGLTIPSNAPHPEEAELFIAYLLGPEGRKIMDDYHHPIFEQVFADSPENIPPSLQALISNP